MIYHEQTTAVKKVLNITIIVYNTYNINILFVKNYKNIKCMTKEPEIIKIDQAVLESIK